MAKNATYEKVIAEQKDLLIKKDATIKDLLAKVAEMEEDASALADAAAQAEEKTGEVAEKAGDVVEQAAESATSTATTDAVSEDTKNLLVETVTNIDPEIGGQLSDEIEKAEDGGLTAEKVSSLMIGVLNSYDKKMKSGKRYGTAVPNKQAALSGNGNKWENAAGNVFSNLLRS